MRGQAERAGKGPGALAWLLRALLVALVALVAERVWFAPTLDPRAVRGLGVVVTGASYGIGREVALQYCAWGARVVVVSRSADKLAKVVSECQAAGALSAGFVAADLSSQDEAVFERVVRESAAKLGGQLDTLVLNHIVTEGAFNPQGWLPLRDMKMVRAMFDTNTFSYFSLAHHALDLLTASGGKIVVVSSGTGVSAIPKTVPYSATKHALHGFFQSLRLDLVMAKSPVTVTMCVLGSIATESNDRNLDPNVKVTKTAADVTARAIAEGGELRLRDVYVPLSLWASRIASVLLPSFMDRLIVAVFDGSLPITL